MPKKALKYIKNRYRGYRKNTYSIFTIAQISHTFYAFPWNKRLTEQKKGVNVI